MKNICLIIISMITGVVIGGAVIGKDKNKKLNKLSFESNKFFSLFMLMDQWMKAKQYGNNLALYLEEEGYFNIAIYGMSNVGERVSDELKNTNINIVYGIDTNAKNIYSKMKIYEPQDELPDVDAVIVTAISFFGEVEKKLSKNLKCPIISLEEIVYQL